ncbi:hypothetical protein AUJ46_03915 [Candidatus Peregrinibacteria bacterium CG1_02_54_53]|nr:MAG: hypothetical protein AUJ46_03915 [Candidatus Peregrinibacteria bacterium CG1_02_54_53]
MWQLFLDLFFPRRSLSGQEGEWITEDEQSKLVAHPVIEETADLRRRGIYSLDRLVAASTYANAPLLKKAIHTFKYVRIPSLDRELGNLLVRAIPTTEKTVVLCPVPLHWVRRFQRGFNQSDRLARSIALERGLPVLPLLKRFRWTGSQMKRTRTERLTGVANAFRCTTNCPLPHVVLIDDLSTTGATLDACARALKLAGVQRVEGWVIAHDHRRD